MDGERSLSNVNRYSDDTYLQENPTWHIEDSRWKADQVVTMLNRANLHPEKVCEVGCGAGEILNVLSKKLPDNVQFVGYEISPKRTYCAKSVNMSA